MSDKVIKLGISSAVAGITAYFNVMLVPIIVLVVSMCLDYVSGVTAAWFSGTLNSKIGKHGAVRKVCYMLLVVVAGMIDWIIQYGLSGIGMSYDLKYYFGLIVTIWLTLNELISIIENCTVIGVPVPSFIKPIAKRLKIMVEESVNDGDAADNKTGGDDQ